MTEPASAPRLRLASRPEVEERSQASNPENADQAGRVKMETRGLRAYYGSREVLCGIDLSIRERDVTAVIGPSGCGKSTFVRCLNRMHEVVPGARIEGQVLFDGQNVYARSVDPVDVRRRVGLVFQKPNPFPTLSIRDNVLAGLLLAGAEPDDAEELVERSLRKAALWEEVKDRLDASGVSLSGGQQQRLCIARALALEPEVLLMDEPCSALDPIATARVEELVHELRQSYTIVIVTHNMQQAARVANYTAFFYMGALVEYDRTEVVFTRPKERRTEEYITGRFG
jgi:phosphate transport system ATP-binding protein